MKKINRKNLPTSLPLTHTLLWSFLMYYFKVDSLYWGMFIIFMVLYWAACIASIIKEDSVDIFEEGGSLFLNRIREMMNKNKQ